MSGYGESTFVWTSRGGLEGEVFVSARVFLRGFKDSPYSLCLFTSVYVIRFSPSSSS